MLNVVAPTIPAPSPPLTQPLKLALSGATFADGTSAAESDVQSIGVFVFRGSPGQAEFFNQAQKKWAPSPADDSLRQSKPIIGVYKQGATPSWESTLVAVGQKDANGDDVYAAAVNGSPSYFARALVKAKRGTVEETALSGPSAAFQFSDALAKSRFVTEFDTPKTKSEDAHKVRMRLKGDALQTAGYLEIRAQPSFEVEIASCDATGNALARIVLLSSGDIRLTPASGSRVIVEGDVETNRLFYAPAGGGAKQWLA